MVQMSDKVKKAAVLGNMGYKRSPVYCPYMNESSS